MDSRQELQVKQKREREDKEEATIPARVFLPPTDIYETPDALRVALEMPGVDKGNCRYPRRRRRSHRRRPARFLEVPGAPAALHRVQHRPLFAELPPLHRDRSEQDRRRDE